MMRSVSTFLLCCSLQPALLPAQAPPASPAAAPEQGQEKKPPQKLAEWPALKPADQDRVAALVSQFRKDKPEGRKVAADNLVALGDGTTPYLIRLISDRDEATNEQIFAVFDRVLGPQHAALLARESKSSKPDIRRYVVRRLCRFVDPEMKPVLQVATKDADSDIAFFGQLGLLALRDPSTLDAVIDRSITGWSGIRELAAEVLPAARSDDMGRAVAEKIAKGTTQVQAAGLRLFRYLGTKELAVIPRTYLTAEDNNVKKEAVNAMRALHGEQPIENLSVFDSIRMSKEWANK
jgi:hypothetical protein